MRDINNNEILAEKKFLDKDIVEEKQIDAKENIESNHLDKILTENIIRNIEKLDKISKNFSLLFEKPISSARESDVLSTMPENSKHIEIAIEKLKNESKQNISLFDEKLSELKSILSRGVNLNDNVLLEKIANIIADIENINYSISSINDKIENFSEVYEQKKIFESGFVDSTEISNKKNELSFQKREYSSKFWRKIIYRNKIKDIDSEVKSLNNIKYDKYRYFFAPTIDYQKRSEFKKIKEDIYLSYILELGSIVENLSDEKIVSEKFDPTVLDSLKDDYLKKYFYQEIEKQISGYEKGDITDWGGNSADILKDPKYIEEALSILKEGFNRSIYTNGSHSEEERSASIKLTDRLNDLPTQLKDIIWRHIIQSEKTKDDEFNSFVENIEKNLLREKILPTIDLIKKNIIDKSEYFDEKRSVTQKIEKIESLLQPKDEKDFLENINLEIWDVIKNNKEVQKIYGVEALDLFDKKLKDKIFSKLMLTKDHSDYSINLGMKAYFFTDPVSVSYNILNFWREAGISGEKTFLSIHSGVKNTLAVKYINSLSEDQLNRINNLKIPGLMEIISIIENHPNNDFRNSLILENGDWVENPVYTEVQEALKKINRYYLENGNDKEKIFSIYSNTHPDFYDIRSECFDLSFNSNDPIETYKKILILIDEFKPYNERNNSQIKLKYISNFIDNNNETEKKNFILFIEETKKIPTGVLVKNWDYLYEKYRGLSSEELVNFRDLLENFTSFFLAFDKGALKDDSFNNIFETYSVSDLEHRAKMVRIIEQIPNSFMYGYWTYIYEKFINLSEVEFEKSEVLAKKMEPYLNLFFFKGLSFEKVFEKLLNYTTEEQNKFFETLGITNQDVVINFEEKDWNKAILTYVNDHENVKWLKDNIERKESIEKLFDSPYRNIVLDKMTKEWQSFLESENKYLPPGLFFISKIIDHAGGAGNLKHFESLGNLIWQTNIVLENEKTTDGTKKEIKQLMLNQEKRFNKERFSLDDRSEFYSLSTDIIEAAPSLYSSFAPIFESISVKEMKSFIEDVFPFYQAQLIIIQDMDNNGNVKYEPRDLVLVRQGLQGLAEKILHSPNDIKNILDSEKLRLIEIVKNGFNDRFGLIKIPENFSKEDLRSIRNGIRYVGNISDRSMKRETIIAFYIGLEINNKWDDFRQGKEIKPEEYFSDKQAEIIKPLLKDRIKSYELIKINAGITDEQMPKFQEILQEDTVSNMVGNIETVDIKLGSIKRNIEELADPDIYEDQKDKEIVKLLMERGKSVGIVLAKTFQEASGREVFFFTRRQEYSGSNKQDL